MKIKTSWSKLIQASNAGSRYLAAHPEKTKLEYAIQRTLARIAKTNDTLQELLEGIDIQHAAVDKDGVCVMVQQGVNVRTGEPNLVYQFKPDQKKARNIARTELLNKPEIVEIDAYFVTQIPEDHNPTDQCGPNEKKLGKCLCGKPLDITESDLDAFEGIIITVEDVARIREARENRLEPEIKSSVAATQET